MMIYDTLIQCCKTIVKLLSSRGVRRSYSQNGEDVIIQSLLGRKPKGVYVDVGAFHPIQYSNTYALYRRGWSGIAIDPNPRCKNLFKIFRYRDKFVQTGIGLQNEEQTYYEYSDSAYNTVSLVQAEEWKGAGIFPVNNRTVRLQPLAEILRLHKVTSIDVLSIDVEGLDFDVLSSHDWSVSTRIIVIESHKFDPKYPDSDVIFSFMVKKGYVLVGLARYSLIFYKK